MSALVVLQRSSTRSMCHTQSAYVFYNTVLTCTIKATAAYSNFNPFPTNVENMVSS